MKFLTPFDKYVILLAILMLSGYVDIMYSYF